MNRLFAIIERIFTQKKYVRVKTLSVLSPMFSDRLFLKLLFPLKAGYKLNLDNPQTFNEKLQWLKINDRHSEYTRMVDKVDAKDYVANKIGEKYIIPTLAIYERAEDIDFESLPNKFVLKCTHDSGGVIICKDKSTLNKKHAIKVLAGGLKRRYYYLNREWPYKNVKPRIIAEKYMSDGDAGGLRDYKFFCFNGEPKAMFLLKDRQIESKLNFYDMDFNKLPFERGYPNFTDEVEKPEEWDEMIKLAKILSKDIPFVRVDFYDINGAIYFGELTFFPGTGMEEFKPKEWDYTFGSWIKLPLK